MLSIACRALAWLCGIISLAIPIVSHAHADYQLLEAHPIAANDLVARLLPSCTHAFEFSTKVKCRKGQSACFRVTIRNAKVLIKGSTGVELASGFYEFLKRACNSSISWQWTGGDQINTSCLEKRFLEKLDGTEFEGHRATTWQYYQNVVTVSYSSTWWDWPRWEREIDWMAMNGINLPLAFTGQEIVWQRVFARYGILEDDLRGFFTGPAFLAWGRMGNIQGYMGPMPQQWVERQAGLQKKILARMRAFGMTPVLPAFAGFVPRALAEKFPNSTILDLPNWGGFPREHCCVSLLDPLDPLFHDIGKATVQEMRREFGIDLVSFYSADTFNEMLPPHQNPGFLASISRAVYAAMAAADAEAKWLMQAWTFFNDRRFWQRPQIQAYISGVPEGRLVLLDLYAEVSPMWKATDSFMGEPFIWCMLHNFGGNSEMYGDLEAVATQPAQALRANSSVIGFGLCMEAIEQNPVVYSLMSEWAFRDSPINLDDWLPNYVKRRYGRGTPATALEAWTLLKSTVYDATDRHLDHAKDVPTSHPGLEPEEVGQWSLRPELWYNDRLVVEAWHKLIVTARLFDPPPATLLYDLVDVGRQVLSKQATKYWRQAVKAFRSKDRGACAAASRRLSNLLIDLDSLLSTHKGFLLGARLDAAKAAADSPRQAEEFGRELLTQITVWGRSPDGPSELEDYANREWAGLIGDYYLRRWQLWIARLDKDLEEGSEYNATEWQQECLQFSESWLQQSHSFASEPSGSAINISACLISEYFPEQSSIDTRSTDSCKT